MINLSPNRFFQKKERVGAQAPNILSYLSITAPQNGHSQHSASFSFWTTSIGKIALH
ncbi:MAG: hypothetical protein BAJATHORv1_10541 [Candidatus Thorarchaeota archaeon]|nr:MAG: hypothetical protein BAJATHORv1_10541 [Candidatus Thorarchaeota archaeon]